MPGHLDTHTTHTTRTQRPGAPFTCLWHAPPLHRACVRTSAPTGTQPIAYHSYYLRTIATAAVTPDLPTWPQHTHGHNSRHDSACERTRVPACTGAVNQEIVLSILYLPLAYSLRAALCHVCIITTLCTGANIRPHNDKSHTYMSIYRSLRRRRHKIAVLLCSYFASPCVVVVVQLGD